MIYFFDTKLKIVDIKNEISYSFNKKANREGSGKIEVESLPNPFACYVSIYENNEYIISGLIKEWSQNNKCVSLSFCTFEALLKNYKMPKVFESYEGYSFSDIISNLFYSFNPIIKSKKKDFNIITNGYSLNAYSSLGVLHSYNIDFGKIRDGDFHLSFNKTYIEKNEYRYNTSGFIVFQFDLGKPKAMIKQYRINGENKVFIKYGLRFLRFSASLGNKAFIHIKAIESDEPFTKWDGEVEELFEKTSYIEIDKSKKDFEKNIGVPLPNKKQYVLIQFIFIYDQPNWIQDFSTLEVYDENKALHKRTVRGFTPVLHAFEILNRKAIPPFIAEDSIIEMSEGKKEINISKLSKIVFEGESPEFNDKEVSYEKKIWQKEIKTKFENISFYDVLIKLLDETKNNIAFDLKPKRLSEDSFTSLDGGFFISVFDNNYSLKERKHGFNKTSDEKAILRLHDDEYKFFNNYVLKEIKRTRTEQKMFHFYGEGEAQDILYLCLFTTFNNDLEEELNIYVPSGTLDDKSDEMIKRSHINKVKSLPYASFIEERIEESSIKDFPTLIEKAISHFLEVEKKEAHSFEIETNLDVHLYDQVLLLHQKSGVSITARIVEEKISLKSNKKTKTLGVGDFLFNPFASLFQKKPISLFISKPQTPFNIKANTQDLTLTLSWDSLGDYDGFYIKVSRLDQKPFSNNTQKKVMYFYSRENQISLNSFNENILYCLTISSQLGIEKSLPSIAIYFKITKELIPIRILKNLNEKGSKEGEVAFFLDIEYRKKIEVIYNIARYLKKSPEEVREINNISEIKTDNLLEKEIEEIDRFLGIEYVWKEGQWVDRRFRLAKNSPLFYFDFSKVSNSYNLAFFTYCKELFDLLKNFEEVRQRLQFRTLYYKLPSEGHNETFGIGNGQHQHNPNVLSSPLSRDWLNPPVIPPRHPIILKPISPYNDRRLDPSDDIRKEYDREKRWFEAIKKVLFDKLQKLPSFSSGYIFDVSGLANHIEYNTPIFELLKNQWQYSGFLTQNSFYSQWNGVDKNCGVFLGNAISLYWQSTLKLEGADDVCWRKDKPQFFITKINKPQSSHLSFGQEAHTFSFYIKFESGAGVVELWNINNYNVGFVKNGYLHFAAKLYNKNKGKEEYHVFYKYKLFDISSTRNNAGTLVLEKPYIHIMVMAEYSTLTYNGSCIISQKIYINFDEVPTNMYEDGNIVFSYFEKDLELMKPKNEVSFLDFKEIRRADEEYIIDRDTKKEVIEALPRFKVSLSNMLLFDYFLDYGERQYIKNCGVYPVKKDIDEKGNNLPNINIDKDKKPKYKGVCVDDVAPSSKDVNIYNNGKVSFEKDEFFLMGRNSPPFQAGVLYSWNGFLWQALMPYSQYHKEYSLAFNDIIEMRALLSDVFFKEFITNTLFISSSIYSTNMNAKSLIVEKELFFNGSTEDPHIKGAIYSRGGRLFISNG